MTRGSVDDVNKMMNITAGLLRYEGTITEEKNFSGKLFFLEFSISYVSPTGN